LTPLVPENGVSRRIKNKKKLSLNIELGCKLSIQLEGVKERLSSFLIGMEPNLYLIIKKPLRGSSEYLVSEGSDLIIRYVHLGEVYGFHATALISITNPTTITFLSYPQRIEKINLRKNPRINSIIPAYLNHEKDKLNGVIKNLSTQGIKFTTKTIENSILKDILIGDEVSISFPLPGINGNLEIQGTIRNKSHEEEETGFGIEFNDKNAEAIGMIDAYINQVKDYT